jgi:hypothetical protein
MRRVPPTRGSAASDRAGPRTAPVTAGAA